MGRLSMKLPVPEIWSVSQDAVEAEQARERQHQDLQLRQLVLASH
jgi:hypothetical protein